MEGAGFHPEQNPEHIYPPYYQLIYYHYYDKRRNSYYCIIKCNITTPLIYEIRDGIDNCHMQYIKRQYSFTGVNKEPVAEV